MWRWSPTLNEQPSAWFGDYPRSDEARQAADQMGATDFFVAWVEDHDYASLMPSAQTLLSEARERAIEAGSPADCFDLLEVEEVEKLDGLLRATVGNWERWIGQRNEETRCNVVTVKNLRRHIRGGDDD